MLIYREGAGKFRAIYADGEGHVIPYAVTCQGDGGGAVFLSDAAAGAPRFRLSYRRSGDREVTVRFEMTRPGTEEFKTYVEGTGRRK